MRQLIAVAVVLVALLPRTSLAQERPSPASRADAEVVRVSSDLVVLDALVVNKKTGQTVGGLKAEDFEIYEDGVRQSVGYFGQDELPLSVLLLLDVSGSVLPVIKSVSDGALEAMRQLKPADEVAVMAFADEPRLVQTFTRDRQLIAERIKNASQSDGLGRSTMMNRALFEAALHMSRASNPKSRRVIIVVSDNIADAAKGGDAMMALDEMADSGTVVYGLIVRAGIGKMMNVMTAGLVHPLNAYAEQTGGEIIGADKKEVEEKLAVVFAHLRARYNLGYSPTNTREDGRLRRVELKLAPAATASAEARKEQLVVRTRQGYYFIKPAPTTKE